MQVSFVLAMVCLLLLGTCGACGQAADPPPDFQSRTIAPKRDVEAADSIVLAFPTAHRDLRTLVLRETFDPPQLADMEVTLKVLKVIKGPTLPQEIRFRYFDGRGLKFLTGPPRGPSGALGTPGIFFLRGTEGSFRSVVDVFRPDIPTRWISQATREVSCMGPPECIADVLLSVRESDNSESFSAALLVNVAIARDLVGYLQTLQLLTALVGSTQVDQVTSGACNEMSKWYPLETPERCRSALTDTAAGEYEQRIVSVRNAFEHGGLPWLRNEVQPKNKLEMVHSLELLAVSPDAKTRQLAKGLLATLP